MSIESAHGLASTADCWALLQRLASGSSRSQPALIKPHPSQEPDVLNKKAPEAIMTLLDSRLPVQAFTAERVECLIHCVLLFSPGQPSGTACGLLSHWALLTISPTGANDPASTRLLSSCAGAAVSLLETQPLSDVWSAALHCLALCCLGTLSLGLLGRALLAVQGPPPAGLAMDGEADMKAARALAHLALACAFAGCPQRASEVAAAMAVLWQGASGCLLPLQDIAALVERLGEAMLTRLPHPAQHIEGAAGSSRLVQGAHRAPEPPEGGVQACWAMAGAFQRVLLGGDVTARAVAIVGGTGLLRAWGSGGHSTAPPPGVRVVEGLENALREAVQAASSAERPIWVAAAVAQAPVWVPGWRPPEATPNMALCLADVLLAERLEVSPLFRLARSGRPSSDGEQWLLAWRKRRVLPDLQVLLVAAMGHLRETLATPGAAAYDAACGVFRLLEAWTRQLHLGFCEYVCSASREWLEPKGSVATLLRDALNDIFSVVLALLALLDRSEARNPAQTLAILACIEFARVPLAAHGQLLSSCLTALPADQQQAGAVLGILSSASPELIHQGDGDDPTGLGWAIRSSRSLLLMSAACLALPAVPSCWGLAVLAEAVIPVAAPYLRHGPQQLSAAANSLCCQLLRRAAVNGHPPLPGQDQDTGHLVESISAFYLSSALEGFPAHTSARELGLAASGIMAALPPDSPVLPWMVGEMAEKAIHLSSESGRPNSEAEDAPEVQLMHLASECLTEVGIMVQDASMSTLRTSLVAAHEQPRRAFLVALQKRIVNSDNCVMKARWVRWYHRLADQCLRAPNHSPPGEAAAKAEPFS